MKPPKKALTMGYRGKESTIYPAYFLLIRLPESKVWESIGIGATIGFVLFRVLGALGFWFSR